MHEEIYQPLMKFPIVWIPILEASRFCLQNLTKEQKISPHLNMACFSSYPLTEQVGQEILTNLHSDREKIQRSRDRVSLHPQKLSLDGPQEATLIQNKHTHGFLTKQLHRLTNTWLDQIWALWDDTKCPRSDTWQENRSGLKCRQLTPARTSLTLAQPCWGDRLNVQNTECLTQSTAPIRSLCSCPVSCGEITHDARLSKRA